MLEKIKKILGKLFKRGAYYVGSSDILPEPLSKEEEEEALELAAFGDEISKNKLIEHNLRLVVFLAKKYENTNIDLEDLVSIGTIGLIKGINTYKMGKNIKLARTEIAELKTWFDTIYTKQEQKLRRLITLKILCDDGQRPEDKLITLYNEAERKRKHIQELEAIID